MTLALRRQLALLSGLSTLVLACTACAPTWKNVRKQEPFTGPSRAYVAMLPEDWKRAPTDSDVLLITRDGLFLQQISITRHRLNEAFSDVAITPDALPQELATLQFKQFRWAEPELARYTKDERKGVLALFPVAQGKPLPGTTERVAMRPVQLDGREAFRLETTSRNGWGLEYVSQSVGFVHEGDYWLVRYLAPKLHYAQRDQATFDGFLAQLKLKPKCFLFCGD